METLRLNEVPSGSDAPDILSEFPSYDLKRLKIEFPNEKLYNACFSVPYSITKLDLVITSPESTVKLLESLCNVTQLHLRSPDETAGATIFDLPVPASVDPRSLSRLESLQLSSVYMHGPDESSPAFLNPSSKLKALYLHRGKLPDAFFTKVASQLSSLETVSLRGCDLKSSVFVHIRNTTLLALSIISCSHIQAEVIPFILSCPKLERLDIGLTFVDMQIFTPPGDFSSLKSVRFGPLETTQNGTIIPAAQTQQNVLVFTFGSVFLLDRHFPNLETLHLMSKVWVVFPTPGAEGSPSTMFQNLTSIKVRRSLCFRLFLYCCSLASFL